MNIDYTSLIFNVGSIALCFTLLINSATYYFVLHIKDADRYNLILQFIGLISCVIFLIGLYLINIGYLANYPEVEAFLIDIPWLLYANCYFIVFYRQSDILLPRKLYYFCWFYLVFINGVGCYDLYLYYMEYVVNPDDYFDLANLMDFTLSLMFLFIEFLINMSIIFRILNKVRNQSDPHYKVLVAKLCTVLFFYFSLDIILMSLDITNNQMYACFFWGINYGFKIQMETLCLGKIREVIVIMETYHNA
jgi:hypothetical protein